MTFQDIVLISAALSPILGLGGAWAITRHQTSDHAKAIEKLALSKAGQDAEISTLRTEVAVLKSQAAGADRRLTESLSSIRETIKQLETSVIAHFDSAVQALKGDA